MGYELADKLVSRGSQLLAAVVDFTKAIPLDPNAIYNCCIRR
jgi:hypothetical protein